MRKWLWLAMLQSACVGAGLEESEPGTYTGPADAPDIVNSVREPSPNEQNYAVRLVLNQPGLPHHCTGTLIAPNVVLTARHCIEKYEAVGNNWRWLGQYHNVLVQIGTHVNHLVTHQIRRSAIDAPNRIGTGFRGNDIALLRLIQTTDAPIARVSAYPVAEDTEYTAIGWGASVPNGPAAERRQQATYRVTNRGTFAYQSDGSASYSRAEMDGGKALCAGDSGGPLLTFSGREARVVGIASLANCSTRSIYQSPSAHLPFICGGLRASGNRIPANLLCSTYASAGTTPPARCCSGDETLPGF